MWLQMMSAEAVADAAEEEAMASAKTEGLSGGGTTGAEVYERRRVLRETWLARSP